VAAGPPATQGFKTPFTENIAKAGNLVLWLRADVGVTHSSGLVDVWQDQATALGGANSAAGEGASRPLWVLDGIGGRPAVRFDGNNDLLSIPDHDALDLGTGAGKGWTWCRFTAHEHFDGLPGHCCQDRARQPRPIGVSSPKTA
jgi:hypothetical protein